MLVFEYIIFISRIADVDQVVRNRFPIYRIVGQVLSGPDIHRTVDLSGVGADDLRVQPGGERCGKCRFAGCCRP